MAVLRAKELTKTYQAGKVSVRALNGISLSVGKGSFTSVIGKSGSGKTTLLNVLSGLEIPDSGVVYLGASELTRLKDRKMAALRRQKIGFVFQKFYLIPEFTVWENILIPFYLDDKNPDIEYVEFLLKEMHMWERKDFFPGELSGGEQQRAAIVRALANRPEILFADEPTGNLDVRNSEEVLVLFQKLQRQIGQTVVMVTHDLDIARRADRIICLEDGKIVSDTEEEHECES
ncbi:MAG: ABC transporter ATP-binding protein [Lachnospiraceae bacterium]|nr:ABC transporter ATP-binding protein [Lachnospiraceae bacterium]